MGLVLDVAPNIFQNVGAAVATSTESGRHSAATQPL